MINDDQAESELHIGLSIVIPTLNRKALLVEALNSIFSLALTEPVEVIISDDGSTDGTGEFLRKLNLASLGQRKMLLRHSATKNKMGAQVARNRGTSLARGKWVMFMDSDDALVPGGIESLTSRLEQLPALDFVFGKVIRTDQKLNPLPGNPAVGEPFSDAPVEVAGYHWHTMGAIYGKSYLEKVGPWNELLTGSQDWEFQARVKLGGGKGEFVDTAVGYWRHHDGARVGAAAFRPDYVRSVMIACDSILHHARMAGRCDQALERRLAKKLVLHALEWGANGYRCERSECLGQAANYLLEDGLWRRAILLFSSLPKTIDRVLWNLLVRG